MTEGEPSSQLVDVASWRSRCQDAREKEGCCFGNGTGRAERVGGLRERAGGRRAAGGVRTCAASVGVQLRGREEVGTGERKSTGPATSTFAWAESRDWTLSPDE